MDRVQELETVKTAYFLEDRLEKLRRESLALSKPPRPTAPVEPQEEHKKAQLKPYPEIRPPEIKLDKFWKRGLILWIVGCVGSLFMDAIGLSILFSVILLATPVVLIIDWSNARQRRKKLSQELVENIRNTVQYKEECRKVDEYNAAAQAEVDKECHERYLKRYEMYQAACQEHQIKLQEYDEEIIPAWKSERADLAEVINQTNNVLQEVYTRKVIPIQYCNISALCYLTMFLSTSEFDLKYAIERYDMLVTQMQQREQIDIAKAQLQVGREVLDNQQYANWLTEQIAEMSERGNQTLESISSWQKADFALREYRRHKAHKAAKKK